MLQEFFSPSAQAFLRYEERPGTGPALILIHGIGCTGGLDYSQVASAPALRGKHCVLIDLIGAGESEKPREFTYTVAAHAQVLTELIRERFSGSVILYGHSLGGPISLSAAENCRAHVRGLILSEANLDPSPSDQPSYKTAQFSEAVFVEKAYPHLFDTVGKPHGIPPTWALTLRTWLPEAMHRLSVDAVRGGKPSWRQRLYDLDCPKTFLFGEKSLPDPDVEELAHHGISVRILSGVGHNMAYEDPSLLAQALADFLIQVESD